MNDNTNNGYPSGPPIPGGGGRRRFVPGDVVIADWVWGVDGWRVHPVIQVSRHAVTVGTYRVPGGWLTTEMLRWEDIRGVVRALPNQPTDLDRTLDAAVRRIRQGSLNSDQRAALAALLQLAGAASLPTPVTAALFTAVTALTRTTRDSGGSDGSYEGSEEDRS